ncbi:MAG: regulatory protein RecX [Pseudomonadota bacterium]
MADSAKQVLLAMLARREHCRFELARKLQHYPFSAAEITTALDELAANNSQSDQRFTEAYIRMRYNKGYGPCYIHQQLTAYQLDDALIVPVLQDYDWFALAIAVRQKKFGNSLPNTPKEKAKQMRFLQYRGFDHEQIKQAILGIIDS